MGPERPLAEAVAEATELIDQAQRIVVLTGAGISTDSGIPDFRGPDGLWTRNPGMEAATNINNFLSDGKLRAAMWRGMRHLVGGDEVGAPAPKPNLGHLALTALGRRGKLSLLVT